MSETFGTSSTTGPDDVVHEAYSFACLRCAHAWEQSYEIRHRTGPHGATVVAYSVEGRTIPSPLTRPTCENCGGHLIRIMQAGTVSALLSRTERARGGSRAGRGGGNNDRSTPDRDAVAEGGDEGRGGGRHHWHLPAILRNLSPHRRSGPAA
ncbi:hypothetical protein AQ490_23665 [Wenjunlia vitaminophila]|uniref:C2H2-type domain-containing protein n=1 Tax=Wenjunlia vitaminophila TaxID=76728 RepID=A0A0T6LRU9_WENVI|nr:hypothetical protein [Wenjunlia vitaminophila]KRV48858.1 hypothetical protein AQ490_23665 [Wenjunlia vitaminophila]